MGLSDLLREWWNGPLVGAVTTQLQTMQATLNRLETNMASGEAEIQAGIKRVSDQIDLAVVELKRLADALEAHQDVDLTQEVADLNALADRLDAAVPDAPPADPVEPVA